MGFIEASGLHFAGFSNPAVWDPARLLEGELLQRASSLPLPQQWALIEQLDPDISHFEFFVSAQPVQVETWGDDQALLDAYGELQPCLWGWPSASLLGTDLEPISLDEPSLALLQAVEQHPGTSLKALGIGAEVVDIARDLCKRRLLLLKPRF